MNLAEGRIFLAAGKNTRPNSIQQTDRPESENTFHNGRYKTESEPGEIVPLKTKLPVSYKTKHHHVGITIKKIKQQDRRVIVDYQFSGIDVSKADEDQLMNVGESIGLGNTKK